MGKVMTLAEFKRMVKLNAEKRKMLVKEPVKAPIIEETPHLEEVKEEFVESKKEEQETEQNVEVVKPAPKKKKSAGKKPANREYMVVENIDEVNEEEPKTEIDF